MKKHPYRTLLIWALIAVSLVLIYPTIGWMTLPSDVDFQNLTREERLEWQSLSDTERWADARAPREGTREYRMERWRVEDRDPVRRTAGLFGRLKNRLVRWLEFDRNMVINLGLDLQGGIHMVIGFDLESLPIEEKRELLRNYDSSLDVDAMNDGQLNARLGDVRELVQSTILQQVRRRVNEFEAQEPIIQTLGDAQIQIQLPGEKDIDRAVRLIKKTAQLNFHLVAGPDEARPIIRAINQEFPAFETFFVAGRGADLSLPAANYAAVAETISMAEQRGLIPEDKVLLFSPPPKPEEEQRYTLYCLERTPIQTGEGLRMAAARPDQANPPYWQIVFGMTNQAGAHFGEVTGANVNRRMAIVVDDVALSAPVIRDQITTSGVIQGDFAGEEARDLAIALNSGSMTVPVYEEFTRVVGPSLGADSVRRGVTSAVVGISIVAVFMLIYYMAAGLAAVVALVLNAIFVIAAMAYFNLTLTLPGIAGLILTVGMAVDANVLIFERIREELRLGHSLAASVANGFDRAAVTILDANVTTLIAALVLMQFGTGPIQGFSIALTIGIVSSVFTALVVGRALFEFLLRKEWLTKLTMLSIIKPGTQIPFMSGRKAAAAVSFLAVAAGMGLFASRGQENFGVDFTSGTNLEVVLQAGRNIPVGEVRTALESGGYVSPVVQEVGAAGDANHFLIRVSERTPQAAEGSAASRNVAYAEVPDAPAEEEQANTAPLAAAATAPDTYVLTVGQQIRESLAQLTDSGTVAGVEVIGEQDVGPAVGKQLRTDALAAITAAILFIIVYLWFRFEFRFAIGAVAALIHDVLITLGMFAVTGRQIDMPVVAAILTIIGYSLNDTIVVFDRIREDMQLYRGKGFKLLEIMNMSINQTLSRTLLTSLTTLFVVVVLFLFGGVAINDFAFALIVGICVGTYSSIFIATPAVHLWQRLFGRTEQPVNAGEGGKGKKKVKKERGNVSPA